MTTKIHIREIRPSQAEVDQMESVGLAAFTNIAFHRLMFPRGEETRAEERRWRSQRLRGSLMNPAKRFVVAVEETVLEDGKSTSKIVGWSQWATPPDVLAPEKTEEEKENEWQERMKSWPDAMDKQAYRKIQEAFEGYEKQWLAGTDPRDYFVLDALAVHPEHQKKGLGRKLTTWGIEEAAKDGKGVGLIARPAGKPLYASLGFEIIGPEHNIAGDLETPMRLGKPMSSKAVGL